MLPPFVFLLDDGCIILLFGLLERRVVVGSSEAGAVCASPKAEEELGTPLLRRRNAAVVVGKSALPESVEVGEEVGDWLERPLLVLLATLIAL